MAKRDTLYAWRWIGGGYNSCLASNRKEAIAKGNAAGAAGAPRCVVLVVDQRSLVSGREAVEWLERMDTEYRSLCD